MTRVHRDHPGAQRIRLRTGVGGGFGGESKDGAQLAGAVYVRMRSQTLLDEGRARTRHADDEHRGRIGPGRGRAGRKPVRVEDGTHPVHLREGGVDFLDRGLRERTVGLR